MGVLTISLTAVFLAKNTRLPRQKCPQVSKLAALFPLHSGIFTQKTARKPNVNTLWRRGLL
ncbi:hypothetical protein HMPREF9123_0824 [Neisseria bacilliformis ATCC BAA-1200]|uniref:Uncharacterized protein n=1 Tax=Neisseria bacilliformis ATCC BAA-1200 TaxID=888742 RepID=F2BAS0_9NEIS|nr:hypothetical protein HMPREF9123_0824 [Neisseria bacilliformis ATCC BAA-1200]